MDKLNFNTFDNLSLQDLEAEAEFIPLMTSEDEEALNKEALPQIVPILPLKNTVLFPGVVIPITAGRDKSIQLIKDANSTDKIGTTRKGIGPAYEDKIGRRGIRVMDLANEKNLSKKIDTMLFHHNSIRKGLEKKIVNKDQLMKELLKISSEILK